MAEGNHSRSMKQTPQIILSSQSQFQRFEHQHLNPFEQEQQGSIDWTISSPAESRAGGPGFPSPTNLSVDLDGDRNPKPNFYDICTSSSFQVDLIESLRDNDGTPRFWATSADNSKTSMNLANNTHNTPAKFGNTGPGGGAVAQACAACKYQRRRCPPDCPFAPYFPADKQNDFRNVRKVYGVKNISRTLKELPPDQHQTAVNSIVFEANLRAADPVGGCLRKVRELNQGIRIYTAELNLVRQQLAFCRSWVQHKKDVKFVKQGIEYDRIVEEHDKGFDVPLGFDHQGLVEFEKKAS